ncbi:MAG: hydroxyacid dehydrogenase [Planctomycetes bacterium]|nr:hydroxyacid dehydrogenase [Planctomycetota bacterium]
MVDVYFYEAFAEEEAALRELLPQQFSAAYTAKTIQESGDAAPPSRLISIRTQSQLPPAWATQLDAILARATGYDHLLAYAASVPKAPALGYLPLYCQRAVAEQAMLMWMTLMRRLPRQMRQFRTFHRDGLTGSECAGRTLVVVGVGNIGHEVCRIGQGLGMRVLGVDLEPRFADLDYESIDVALPQADVIVCAMNLNRANHGFFNRARWKCVKPGAVFINISRGELSPATALLEALAAGQLGGVGLDVFEDEPKLATALRSQRPMNDPEVVATLALAERDDCLCTPHNAFNTAEAVARKSEHSVQQIVSFLDSGAFLWTPPDAP